MIVKFLLESFEIGIFVLLNDNKRRVWEGTDLINANNKIIIALDKMIFWYGTTWFLLPIKLFVNRDNPTTPMRIYISLMTNARIITDSVIELRATENSSISQKKERIDWAVYVRIYVLVQWNLDQTSKQQSIKKAKLHTAHYESSTSSQKSR